MICSLSLSLGAFIDSTKLEVMLVHQDDAPNIYAHIAKATRDSGCLASFAFDSFSGFATAMERVPWSFDLFFQLVLRGSRDISSSTGRQFASQQITQCGDALVLGCRVTREHLVGFC